MLAAATPHGLGSSDQTGGGGDFIDRPFGAARPDRPCDCGGRRGHSGRRAGHGRRSLEGAQSDRCGRWPAAGSDRRPYGRMAGRDHRTRLRASWAAQSRVLGRRSRCAGRSAGAHLRIARRGRPVSGIGRRWSGSHVAGRQGPRTGGFATSATAWSYRALPARRSVGFRRARCLGARLHSSRTTRRQPNRGGGGSSSPHAG